jgi:hypothetical protein
VAAATRDGLGTGFLVRVREAAARAEGFFFAALEAVDAPCLLEPFRAAERFLTARRFANVSLQVSRARSNEQAYADLFQSFNNTGEVEGGAWYQRCTGDRR